MNQSVCRNTLIACNRTPRGYTAVGPSMTEERQAHPSRSRAKGNQKANENHSRLLQLLGPASGRGPNPNQNTTTPSDAELIPYLEEPCQLSNSKMPAA